MIGHSYTVRGITRNTAETLGVSEPTSDCDYYEVLGEDLAESTIAVVEYDRGSMHVLWVGEGPAGEDTENLLCHFVRAARDLHELEQAAAAS